MAHRVNVTPVEKSIPSAGEDSGRVKDPICGQEITRRESRYMLFRADEVYYFCSKECQEKFVHPTKSAHAA